MPSIIALIKLLSLGYNEQNKNNFFIKIFKLVEYVKKYIFYESIVI